MNWSNDLLTSCVSHVHSGSGYLSKVTISNFCAVETCLQGVKAYLTLGNLKNPASVKQFPDGLGIAPRKYNKY
jgi:hypothetical protein